MLLSKLWHAINWFQEMYECEEMCVLEQIKFSKLIGNCFWLSHCVSSLRTSFWNLATQEVTSFSILYNLWEIPPPQKMQNCYKEGWNELKTPKKNSQKKTKDMKRGICTVEYFQSGLWKSMVSRQRFCLKAECKVGSDKGRGRGGGGGCFEVLLSHRVHGVWS